MTLHILRCHLVSVCGCIDICAWCHMWRLAAPVPC